MKQSYQVYIHCLPFRLHLLHTLLYAKTNFANFKIITGIVLGCLNFFGFSQKLSWKRKPVWAGPCEKCTQHKSKQGRLRSDCTSESLIRVQSTCCSHTYDVEPIQRKLQKQSTISVLCTYVAAHVLTSHLSYIATIPFSPDTVHSYLPLTVDNGLSGQVLPY